MALSFSRVAVGSVVVFGIALGAIPDYAAARELATAQGAITISEPRPGLRAASCSELVVEARDALDNHLIAETQPILDEARVCRYALTVPAQTAVWLRLQAVLISGARAGTGIADRPAPGRGRPSAGSVALRFTIIAATTYFLAPGEQRIVPLSY